MIKRLFCAFTICLVLLALTSCEKESKNSKNDTISKYESLEDVSKKLQNTVSGSYEYTYVFNDFGDRTVLQLDKQDATGNLVIPYCLIFPKNYDPNVKYPVLTYLHGAGEKGDDNNSHLSLMIRYCKSYPQFLDDAFIVCPQCPDMDWWNATGNIDKHPTQNLDVVMSVLEELPNYCSVDTDRYYVTGVSMGGFGTFNIISAYPDKFAAAVPICGGGNTYYADRLIDIPIWLFHSRDDNIVSFSNSQSMYDAIKNAGGEKIKFTVLNGMGHNSWNATEHNDELFRWIFYQSLSGEPALNYSHMLEIRGEANSAIFNESDFALSIYGEGEITLFLTDSNYKFYEEITSSKGKPLTVYYEGKSIGKININKKVSDGKIVFKTTLTAQEALAFCDKI